MCDIGGVIGAGDAKVQLAQYGDERPASRSACSGGASVRIARTALTVSSRKCSSVHSTSRATISPGDHVPAGQWCSVRVGPAWARVSREVREDTPR